MKRITSVLSEYFPPLSSALRCSLAFVALATPHHALAIFNGFGLAPGDLPQMGKLLGSHDQLICSLTLVGPNVVATAAHCARAGIGLRVVLAGATYTPTFLSHDDYSKDIAVPDAFTLRNDVALGMLDRAVPAVSPIPVSDRIPPVGTVLVIAGHGEPNSGARQYGYMRLYQIGQRGITLRGYGNRPQTGGLGDSGGPTFVMDSTGQLSLVAVNSLSTKTKSFLDLWSEPVPFTHGSARVLPFFRQAAGRLGVGVCGVNLRCAPVSVRLSPHSN